MSWPEKIADKIANDVQHSVSHQEQAQQYAKKWPEGERRLFSTLVAHLWFNQRREAAPHFPTCHAHAGWMRD
jgi:hypothetical protein